MGIAKQMSQHNQFVAFAQLQQACIQLAKTSGTSVGWPIASMPGSPMHLMKFGQLVQTTQCYEVI